MKLYPRFSDVDRKESPQDGPDHCQYRRPRVLHERGRHRRDGLQEVDGVRRARRHRVVEHGARVGGEVVEEEHADPVRGGGEDGRQRGAGVGQDVAAPPAALPVDDVHLGVEEEEEVESLR